MRGFVDFFGLLLPLIVRIASADSAKLLCQQLHGVYSEAVTESTEQNYENLRTENWVQTAWTTPTCIFQPRSLQQLQAGFVELVNSNTKFAVRSGGHSPHHGWAGIDDGVLIDMSNFTRLEYDAANSFVIVGAGLTWRKVYTELEKYSAIAVGGRVLDVGVSGLTLGSGLSWLTDLYGLACDNVLNFQVLLSNGSIVEANASSNSNLFRALKGGSNNFGIVTEFKLKTFPLGQVWGGIKTYTLEQLPDLVKAYTTYQSSPNKNPYANLIVGASPTNASIGALLSMVYLKPEADPAVFEPFYHINATSDSTGFKSFSAYMDEYGIPDISRFDWHTQAFEMDAQLYEKVVQIASTTPAIETVKSAVGGFMAVTLQPISSRVAMLGEAQHGNVLGLSPVNQTWLAIATGWLSPKDDRKVHDAAGAVIQQISNAAKTKGKHLPYLFMNDASWDQNVIGSYGEENNKFLKETQHIYDPTFVFQRLVPGGFKLS